MDCTDSESHREVSGRKRTKSSAMEKIYDLLRRPEKSRSRIDLSKLFLHMKENAFFKNLAEKKPQDQVLDIIGKLSYEFRAAGDYLFQKGDVGTRFYIILQG